LGKKKGKGGQKKTPPSPLKKTFRPIFERSEKEGVNHLNRICTVIFFEL
jgi:hypothetical protein